MLGVTWGIDESVLIMKSLRSLRTRYDNFIENILIAVSGTSFGVLLLFRTVHSCEE